MKQPKILVAGATCKTGRVEHGAQLTECPATERRARDDMSLRIQEGTQSVNQPSRIQEHYTFQEMPGRITAGKD